MQIHTNAPPRAYKPTMAETADPTYRIFNDPPETIQIAFGGRPWFFDTGCQTPYRIGLLKGLGWGLDPMRIANSGTTLPGVNHVRVHANPDNTYAIEFLRHTAGSGNDPQDRGTMEPVARIGALTIDQIKSTYVDVLGSAFA